MSRYFIKEPRWHDRVVLLADKRLDRHNEVIIQHKDFPKPYYITRERAQSYPLEQMKTKAGGLLAVRAVPLDELTKEVIDI